MLAAVLNGGPSALASHRSAAVLWRLDGFASAPVEISVQAGRRIDGVRVHRRRQDDNPGAVTINGIPTTCVERTLYDLAGATPARVGRALDDALRRELTTLDSLRRGMPAPGRAGRAAFRRLLDERDERDAVVESSLETKFLRLVRRRGLPAPTPQYQVFEAGVPVARVDFAYETRLLAIEVDGFRWHSGAERWQEGLRRDNRLRLLGWTILHFSWKDVTEHPEVVASQIREAYDNLGQGSLSQLTLSQSPKRTSAAQLD